MPSYPELGRHTPPPPPYSSAQRNCSNAVATCETSQRSDPPPPPPPSFNSTPRKECKIPSHWTLEQTGKLDNPSLCDSSVNKLAPAWSFQFAPAQPSNSGQAIVYHARNHYREPIRFGMPVEPNLVLDSHGRPIRPLGGSLFEERSEPVFHRSVRHDQGVEYRPDYHTTATQSPNPSSLSQIVTSSATQHPPYALSIEDQQALPISRNNPRTTIPSLAYATGLDAPASVDPSRTTYPPSTLPSPQAVTRRPNLSAVSTATTTPMAHRHLASPIRSTGPSNDATSQGHEQWRRASQPNHRRTSVSVRFEPYKRRQSSIAVDNAEASRLAAEAHKEAARGNPTNSDVEMEEGGREGRKR